VDERDSIGDPELFSAQLRLLAKQLTHVYTSAANPVIARPGTQHLARTAAEVQHKGPWFQAQRLAESGELSGVNGLWIRWALSVMLNIRGMSTIEGLGVQMGLVSNQ
jgi:hypothetical protein